MKFVKEDFKERLECKIQEIERLSSVEIVPALIARASHYNQLRFIYALVFWIILSLGSHFISWGIPHFIEISLLSALSALVYFLLGLEIVESRLLPSSLKFDAVRERAEKIFLREEIFATEKRTGLLILISLLEKSIFILADKGLKEKIEDKEWAHLAHRLAKDFDRKNPGASFFEALELLSDRFKQDFPKVSSTSPSLSNRVRES